MEKKQYACIDLKSFYASVECMERGLDPMVTNLVVADVSRTEKTICLAVTPPLKAHGISGRARLFEVNQRLKAVNAERQRYAPGGRLTGASADDRALRRDPSLAVDYIAAPPHMARYIRCSTDIYKVYLKYVAAEDIHVYSIDEVFIDLTAYLRLSGVSAVEFVSAMIADVLKTTGITADSPYTFFTIRQDTLFEGKRVYGHQGTDEGVVCNLYTEPESGLTIVVMSNGTRSKRVDGIMSITRSLAGIAWDEFVDE